MSENAVDRSEAIDNTTSFLVSLNDNYSPPQEVEREPFSERSSENDDYRMYGELKKKMVTIKKILIKASRSDAEKIEQVKQCISSIDFSMISQHFSQQFDQMQGEIDILTSTRQIQDNEKRIEEFTQEIQYNKRKVEELIYQVQQKNKIIEEITLEKDIMRLEIIHMKSQFEKLTTVQVKLLQDSLSEELTKLQNKRSEFNQLEGLYKDQIHALQEQNSQLLLQHYQLKSKEEEEDKRRREELITDLQKKNQLLSNQLQNIKQNTVSLQVFLNEQRKNKTLLEEISDKDQKMLSKDLDFEDLKVQMSRLDMDYHDICDQKIKLDKTILKMIQQRQAVDIKYQQTIQDLRFDLDQQTNLKWQLEKKLQILEDNIDRQSYSNESIKQQIEALTIKHNADQEKMARDEAKIKKLQSQVSELTKQLEDQQNFLEECRTAIDNHRRAAQEDLKRITKLQSILEEKIKEAERLQYQKEQMKEHFTKKTIEHDKKIEQLQKQSKKNQKMKSQPGKILSVQQLFMVLKQHFVSIPLKQQRQNRRQQIKLYLRQYV